MIVPSIQEDIMHAVAKETTKGIFNNLKNDFFGILVYDSHDMSCKEHMALILCYMDKRICCGKIYRPYSSF